MKRKIAFISGVFDGLHRGHLFILSEMRKLAPYTIVSINSDAYARKKGPGRPLVAFEQRRAALYATGLVDEVIGIEDSPLEVIKFLQPTYIVTGRNDYSPDKVVGTKEAKVWGGKAIQISPDMGISTTQLVKKRFKS